MRYNVTFTLKKEKEETKMFKVVENNSYDRARIVSILAKKYPNYQLIINKITQSLNALTTNLT